MVHFQALNIWLYDYMFYCDKPLNSVVIYILVPTIRVIV